MHQARGAERLPLPDAGPLLRGRRRKTRRVRAGGPGGAGRELPQLHEDLAAGALAFGIWNLESRNPYINFPYNLLSSLYILIIYMRNP